MEYTKGKWELKGNKIIKPGQGTIAICPTQSDGVLEFIANAHLIAIAPDMYKALKQAQEGAGDWRGVIDLALFKAEHKP